LRQRRFGRLGSLRRCLLGPFAFGGGELGGVLGGWGICRLRRTRCGRRCRCGIRAAAGRLNRDHAAFAAGGWNARLRPRIFGRLSLLGELLLQECELLLLRLQQRSLVGLEPRDFLPSAPISESVDKDFAAASRGAGLKKN
jgi:hypothetical protein